MKKVKKIKVNKRVKVCHQPFLNCQRFLNHGFAACRQCEEYYYDKPKKEGK